MPRDARAMEIYRRLFAAYGPQHWWPGDGPFEMMAGAILTQNTAWRNVERAIANLKGAGVLSLAGIRAVPPARLTSLVRPSGYFRQKARKLKALVRFVDETYGGRLEALLADDPARLRERLLEVHGVGPETADSIVLYAARGASFVVDAYTHRVLSRHGLAPEEAGYDELREWFLDRLPEDPALFNEYHALVVRVGHLQCRRTPICRGCPLEPLFGAWGVRRPDARPRPPGGGR